MIRELKDAGLVSVVKRGFNNNHGKAHAPIYEVAAFPSSRVAETVAETGGGVPAIQSGGNGEDVPVIQSGGNGEDVPAKSGSVPAKSGSVPAIQGGVLDGSIDGSLDGGRAREAPPTPEPDLSGDDPPGDQSDPFADAAAASAAPWNPHPGPEPPSRCRAHTGWQGRVPDCGACGDHRKAHDRWAAANERWRDGERDAIWAGIAACTGCGPTGWTEPDDPDEPSRRCRRHRQMSDLAPPIPTTTRQEVRR